MNFSYIETLSRHMLDEIFGKGIVISTREPRVVPHIYVTRNTIESPSPTQEKSFTDCLENLKSSTQRGIDDRLPLFPLEIGLDQCGLFVRFKCPCVCTYMPSMAGINIQNGHGQEPLRRLAQISNITKYCRICCAISFNVSCTKIF